MRLLFPLALACGLVLPSPGRAADPGSDPDRAAKPDTKATRYEVPYRLTDTKHVLVRAKINGKGPFNLILDTGAPAVFITKAVAKKAGVDTGKKGLSKLDKFEIEGGVVVEDARARVEDIFQIEGMNSMGLAGVELHGVIGYNVLAKYRIEYDFTADKLGFEPLKNFEPPALIPIAGARGQTGLEMIGPMMKVLAAFMGMKPNFDLTPRGFVGFEFDDADGIVVKKVLAGSPADKAGIKVGDKIDTVGTRGIDDARDLARAIAKARPGQNLKVVVKRDGKEMELSVELGRGL